jgi:hypothetical protein
MAALNGFLALGTLNAAGTIFTEIIASGYARQPIALEPDKTDDVINTAKIEFPAALADWPAFNAYAVFTAVSAGAQIMAWGTKQERIDRRGRHIVPAGDIRLEFPVPRANSGSAIIMSGPLVRSPQQLFASLNVVEVSQAEYDALGSKDARTLYVIPEA